MIEYQRNRRLERGRGGSNLRPNVWTISHDSSGSASSNTIKDWHSPTSASEKKNVVEIIVVNSFTEQRCPGYIVVIGTHISHL